MACLLQDMDLIREPPSYIVEKGLVSMFFPHGLGHLLGIQVHDRGGLLANPKGDIVKPPEDHPNLRFTREISDKQVFYY